MLEQDKLDQYEKDKVPFKQTLAYSFGLITDRYASQSLIHMAMPFYHVLLGVSPAIIGFILGVFRFWDAITDPLVGKLSDNFRSSHGRRRPMIIIGAMASGIIFPLIWLVPETWSELAKVSYLCILLTVYYFAYSIFSVSYSSLGMELTPCYNERTRLFAFRTVFAIPVSIGLMWIVAGAYSDFFSSPLIGMKIISSIIGLIIILGGIICALNTSERYNKLAENQEKIAVFKSLVELKSNKIVMPVLLLMFLDLLSGSLLGSLGFYINSYYVFGGDIKSAATFSGIMNTVAIISTVCASSLMYKFANSISKEKIIFYCLILNIFGTLSKFWTYSPDNPYFMFVSQLILTFSSGMFWIAIISMKADACDWDEHQTGLRREGMISAATNWLNKTGMAIGLILSGFVISWTGFDLNIDTQPNSESLEYMRLVFILGPCFFYIFGLFLINNYSLTRDDHRKVRSELESCRGIV